LRRENGILMEEKETFKKPRCVDRQVNGIFTERDLREPKIVRFRFIHCPAVH
ncbi:MAG: hypothetical protein ACI9BH_000745, partial [Paracoccaceae bacterium]